MEGQDQQYEDFRALKDGRLKRNFISDLREQGHSRLADQFIEDWFTERTQWLKEYNLDEVKVYRDDESGDEYFLDHQDIDEGEERDYSLKRIDVPDYLDVKKWLS